MEDHRSDSPPSEGFPQRQPYHTPLLRNYGRVEELTRLAPGGSDADSNYGVGTPDNQIPTS